MSIPLLLGTAVTPSSPTVNYDFTQGEVLPQGTAYARVGARQGWRQSSGNLKLAGDNEVPWSYSGATLKGVFMRSAMRPLVNLLEPVNMNPQNTLGWSVADRYVVKAPDSTWDIDGLTTVLSTDGVSSDIADALPAGPGTTGQPVTAGGFLNQLVDVTGILTRIHWWTGYNDFFCDYPQTTGPQFHSGTFNQTADSAYIRFRSYELTRLHEWTGQFAYAGNLTLDELDVAWSETSQGTLNAGAMTVNIESGTYAIGTLELGHDDATTANTQEVTVTGGSYQIDPADFGLTSYDVLNFFRTAGAPAPTPENVTFNLEGALPTGVAYAQPYAQIKRDSATPPNYVLTQAGDTSEDYDYQGAPLGRLIEAKYTNKLGQSNVDTLAAGPGATVVDDSAALGSIWSMIPGGRVWDVSTDFLGAAFGNANQHGMVCLARRLDDVGTTASRVTTTAVGAPFSEVTTTAYGFRKLTAFIPQAADQPSLSNVDFGLRGVLWTVVEDEIVPIYPIYDTVGNGEIGNQVVTVSSAAYIAGTYDIVLTFAAGNNATIRDQALSGDISFSADKAATGSTYDLSDFGVTRNERHIKQIQLNVAGSPGPDPTPPPPSGYTVVPRGVGLHMAFSQLGDINGPYWDDIAANKPKARYLNMIIKWSEIELSEGVYDFTILDQYLAKAVQYDVKCIIYPVSHAWSRFGRDPSLYAPQYIVNPTPANFARFGGYLYPGYFQTGAGFFASRRWDNNFMDRYEALLVATMQHVSGRNEVLGVKTSESALGPISGSTGADDVDYLNYWERMIQLVEAMAAVRTGTQNAYMNLNWATGLDQATYLNAWYDRLVAINAVSMQNDPRICPGGKFLGNNYAIEADRVHSRNEIPMISIGEDDGADTAWHTLTTLEGDTYSRKRFCQYNYGTSPTTPANSVPAEVALTRNYFPPGPSTKAMWWDWWDNPATNEGAAEEQYWKDFPFQPEGQLIKKP